MFLIVNLKTYAAGTGEKARRVAADAREVSEETGARVVVSPQPADLRDVAETGVETFAQHVDGVEPGSNTGSVLAESVSEAGASGTLLNHSERRLKLAEVNRSLEAAERAGLETVVCGNNPSQVGAAACHGPDHVAVEPPELIGTGTPVSQADPDVVRGAVERVDGVDPDVSLLCGAGISSGDDVEAALELGAEGVLVASGVVKSESPKEAMLDLVTAV
ncbi:MAG: triose-phosphate isomerase [Halobacteria archaeon]|nr:triose-phosphate isomerase [Halobacteria archaeon]